MASDDTNEKIKFQAVAAATGATYGAITKHGMNCGPGTRGGGAANTASQVAAASATAVAGGAGVGGAATAGTAVLLTKVGIGAAAATAAAPFVLGAAIVGGVGYGLYRLFKK